MAMNARLLRPLTTGWTPRREAGLQFWLDAADAGTITLNSGNVSEWRDKSGKGNHATQGTAASQPAYTLAGQNGRNLVTFDGSNDFMDIPATFMAGISLPFSIYWVFLRRGAGSSSGAYDPALCPIDGANDRGSFHYVKAANLYPASYPFFGSSPSWGNYDVTSGLYTNDVPYVIRFTATDSQWQVFRTGVQEGTTQTRGGVPAAGITALRMCQQPNPLRHANNAVAEMFCVTSPTATANTQAEGYLAWKWGFQASLPAGHPYRNGPPL